MAKRFLGPPPTVGDECPDTSPNSVDGASFGHLTPDGRGAVNPSDDEARVTNLVESQSFGARSQASNDTSSLDAPAPAAPAAEACTPPPVLRENAGAAPAEHGSLNPKRGKRGDDPPLHPSGAHV